MNIIKFTESVYTENDKKGILTPDSNGYYTVVVGALNTYNSVGEYYTAKGALELFENSSHFMRRIKNGALYSELGHPKKHPNMSMEDFYNRIIQIEETNICGHFSEIWLDTNFGKNHPNLNNPELIAIYAKVKPAGPKANALQLALENPKQNAAFSVRGLTENKFTNGRVERRLTNIITFDYVTEPGISVADKVMAPGLEQLKSNKYLIKEITDTIVDKDILKKVISNNLSHVSIESNKYNLFNDIIKTLDNNKNNSLAKW